MTKHTPPLSVEQAELRQQILKAGTVRFATGSFAQKYYSNGTVSPIEQKVQEIVEIGIDTLMELITAQATAAQERAVEHAIIKIMGVKTEGLFDNGDLFIKRAPIEQAVIDLVGYEKFRAIKDSLPVANPAAQPKEGKQL